MRQGGAMELSGVAMADALIANRPERNARIFGTGEPNNSSILGVQNARPGSSYIQENTTMYLEWVKGDVGATTWHPKDANKNSKELHVQYGLSANVYKNGSAKYPFSNLQGVLNDLTEDEWFIILRNYIETTTAFQGPPYNVNIEGFQRARILQNSYTTQPAWICNQGYHRFFNMLIQGDLVLNATSSAALIYWNQGTHWGSCKLQNCVSNNNRFQLDFIGARPLNNQPTIFMDSALGRFWARIGCVLESRTGQPVIRWTLNNQYVTIRRSSIIHGSGGANNPFQNSVAGAPQINYQMTNCEANSDPDLSGNFNNLIKPVNGNIYDPNIRQY